MAAAVGRHMRTLLAVDVHLALHLSLTITSHFYGGLPDAGSSGGGCSGSWLPRMQWGASCHIHRLRRRHLHSPEPDREGVLVKKAVNLSSSSAPLLPGPLAATRLVCEV